MPQYFAQADIFLHLPICEERCERGRYILTPRQWKELVVSGGAASSRQRGGGVPK